MNALKKEALALLREWCDTLMEYEVHSQNPEIDGALLCPACHTVHGRFSDMTYPLTLLYKETGEQKYLDFAQRSIEYSEKHLLCPGGGYNNDKFTRWYGTTAFCALSLGDTLLHYGEELPKEIREHWLTIFQRLSEFCYAEFKNFTPVINYRAGAAAIYAMAYVILKDEKFRKEAFAEEGYCRRHFDENGLLFGEGLPHGATSPKGCHAIDIGYNMEESLPLLILCARMLEDGEMLAFYTERMRNHLEFLLPDGAIDNSFGTRHNKWTYWGSRTSDGVIGGLALLPPEPVFQKAMVRVLALYKKCTHKGLLALPMLPEAPEPVCLHHTFCHTKALAALLNAPDLPACEGTVLPREKEYGIKLFQNGNLALASFGKFRATVSAIDRFNYAGAENFGGSVTLLWHESTGAILAATMHEYIPSEPANMQYLTCAATAKCMTPRVILGEYSSDTDKDVCLTAKESAVSVRAEKWSADYVFSPVRFQIRLHATEEGEYVLPIVLSKKHTARLEGNTLTTENGIKVTASAPIRADLAQRYYNQVGGFSYLELRLPLQEELEISLSCD